MGADAAAAWRGYKPRSFELLALSEGDHVLDLGCGTGEDARVLAETTRGVSVVGVDTEEKVREAHRLTLGIPRPVEFRVGDAHHLEFEDGIFDACRADKVFHHLDDPCKALAEMARVARPRGRVVVSDVDYETLIVDAPDRALTRRILNAFCDTLGGWIGRRLPALFADAGLARVEVVPYTAVVTEYDEEVVRLRDKAERAREAGAVSDAEAGAWLASIEEAAGVGRFFCALTIFTVRGWKA